MAAASLSEVSLEGAEHVHVDGAVTVKVLAGALAGIVAVLPSEVHVDGAVEVQDSAAEVAILAGAVAEKPVAPTSVVNADGAVEVRVDSAVEVKTLAGSVLTTVLPVPLTVKLLKEAVESQAGRQAATQKMVMRDGFRVLEDDEELPQEPLEVFCLTDEAPLWSWDLDSNPAKDHLKVDGPRVTCPDMRVDCVNVITKAPLVSGRHYIEFVMHCIGDEQWCGVVADPSRAGARGSGRNMQQSWTYYCGRMGVDWNSLRDGKGALHAEGKAVIEFEKLSRCGDVIGMLVDLDVGAVAFDRNGKLQGACPIPVGTPLWVVTVVDTSHDDVELRKPMLEDAPPENLAALAGALLDIGQGQSLRYE